MLRCHAALPSRAIITVLSQPQGARGFTCTSPQRRQQMTHVSRTQLQAPLLVRPQSPIQPRVPITSLLTQALVRRSLAGLPARGEHSHGDGGSGQA